MFWHHTSYGSVQRSSDPQGTGNNFRYFLKADDLKDIILKGDRVGLSVLMGIGGREYTYRRLEIQQKVIMMSVIMRFSSDMVTGKGGR